jgi:hypothetical protein
MNDEFEKWWADYKNSFETFDEDEEIAIDAYKAGFEAGFESGWEKHRDCE